MKQLWDNPELTVLVKRKSDEVILAGCKESSGGPHQKDTCRAVGADCQSVTI